MAGSFTDYLEDKILKHVFTNTSYTSPTTVYVGLFTVAPSETVRAVRAALNDSVPLFVRISASDWVPEGWSIEESIELSRLLKDLGVDLVDVSSGGNPHNAPIKAVPGFQVPFATAIKSTPKSLS